MLDKLAYKSKELSQVTGIDIRTWRRLRDLHIIAPIKIGKGEKWLASDIQHFLEWARGRSMTNDDELLKELKDYEINR